MAVRPAKPTRASRAFAKTASNPFAFVGRYFPILFVVFAVGLLIASAGSEHINRGIRGTAADIFSPMLSAVSYPVRAAGEFFGDMTGITALRAENERLVKENVRLKEWYRSAIALSAENKSLKRMMNASFERPAAFLTTRVIADHNRAFSQTLLVPVGSGQGVQKNQAVLSENGLIGRVIEVGERSARILLVTDINSRIPVMVEGQDLHAVLAGGNTASPALAHLPAEAMSEAKIANGMTVMTSGKGGIFPPGLPIGRAVLQEDGDVHVDLLSDLGRLFIVQIADYGLAHLDQK